MPTFNVNQYWLKRGQTYANEERLKKDYHRHQEEFLFHVLGAGKMPMRKIMEMGCGFGSIKRLLSQEYPQSEIVAVDLSPDQLANARRYCSEAANITFQQYDFYSGLPFPGADFDATVAIEVFLHHPPEQVVALLKK